MTYLQRRSLNGNWLSAALLVSWLVALGCRADAVGRVPTRSSGLGHQEPPAPDVAEPAGDHEPRR